MSGKKRTYTSIAIDELQRLQQEARRAAHLAKSNEAMQKLNDTTNRLMRQYQNRVDQMDQRIVSLNTTIAMQEETFSAERQKVREQLRKTVENTNKALRKQAKENITHLSTLEKEFQNGLRQNREEVIEMMAQNSQRIERKISNVRSDFAKEMGCVKSRMDAVESSLGRINASDGVLLDMAREYLQNAQLLYQNIIKYRVDILCPKRRELAKKELEKAEENLRLSEEHSTNASVARISAQQAMENVMQLYEDVVNAQQEWEMHLQAARQALAVTEAQLQAGSKLELQNGEDTVPVDVDYWTDGDISELKERINGLSMQLDDPESLGLSDLDYIREAGVQVCREIQEADEFASIAVYASQDRADIAQEIADCLWDSLNLEIVTHGYQGGDMRAGHRIHLKNPITGFEMVVTQLPEESKDFVIGNSLESDILNYGTKNEEYGEKIAREALEMLRCLGVKMDSVETVQGYERRPSERKEITNMAAWKKEQPSLPKPRHAKPSQRVSTMQ